MGRRRSTKRAGQAIFVGVMALGGTFVAAGPANAAISLGTSLTMPSGWSVGQTQPASFTLTNQNTPPNATESLTVTQIRLAPSCASTPTAGNPCPTPDPGVFSLSPTATGAAGTACAGVVFSVSGPDAAGIWTFTPSSPVVLAPGASCRVDFTVTVLKLPATDVDPAAGVQTRANLRVNAQNPTGAALEAGPSVVVTVNRALPTITTRVFSSYVPAGGTAIDTASVGGVAGVAAPTGTVTFSLYGPDNATCTGSPAASSTNAVSVGSATSSPLTVAQPGVYRFVATYNGDANYSPRSTFCGDAGETLVVSATNRDLLGDFNADARTDVAVYRPSNGVWYVQGQFGVVFGSPGDVPLKGDFNGDGRADVAVYRPSTGAWYVKDLFAVTYGGGDDVPVPADYNGDGRTDVAVYRPSTGQWFVMGQFGANFGSPADVPVPGDYNGDGRADVAVYRPSTGVWFVQNQFAAGFGSPGDVPVPGDYNGDGRTDIAVFRPSNGVWFVQNQFAVAYGQTGDVPVPGDYDGDGTTDVAVFRPSNGVWFIEGQFATPWGQSGDIPVPLPYAIWSRYFSPV